MDDYDKIFKRDIDRLTYMYSKANTKSKLKNMGYDLIHFENMYNLFTKEETNFPWSDSDTLLDLRLDSRLNLFLDLNKKKNELQEIAINSFSIFLDNDFSKYKDYGKRYFKIDEYYIQKSIYDFYDGIDKELASIFINKIKNNEILYNENLLYWDGVFFPIESINKNYIIIDNKNEQTLDDARILVHELGHNFEFENAKRSGKTNIWKNISKTIFPEVSSCFFEYAYINYLIENNICLEDSVKLKRKYLNQIYNYLSYILIIFSKIKIDIDYGFMVKMNENNTVEYANELLDMMNSSEERFTIDDKLSIRTSCIYGIGKLLGVYLYESYKDNKIEFLNNFKKSLLEYKDIDFDAFNRVGVSYQDLVKGEKLKKILKKID